MARNNQFADNIVFGCTKKSDAPDEHVEDLWAKRCDLPLAEYTAVRNAVLESHSKPPKPKLSFPEFMKDPDYRHGVISSNSDEDAKQLIYANYNNVENNCIPGQQYRRNYKWAVDPESTTFGIKGENATSRGSSAGVAEALCIKYDSRHSKDAGTSCKQHDPEKIFGKSTSSPNSSAADCLGHTAKVDESNSGEIDDIGKSLTPGFRNASTSRCFGVPSIRTDIAKYDRASVADTQNYGDDVNAGYLLRPSLFSSFGLQEDEFLKPRSKDYLKRLFQSCGIRIDDHTFEEIFNRVSSKNSATIDSFRNSMEEFPPPHPVPSRKGGC